MIEPDNAKQLVERSAAMNNSVEHVIASTIHQQDEHEEEHQVVIGWFTRARQIIAALTDAGYTISRGSNE